MLSLPHKRLWLAVGWFLIIAVVYGSLMPQVPSVGVYVSDKVQHSTAYFALTLWFTGLYQRRSHWILALVFLVMGALLELLQALLTTTRAMDYHDLIANSGGIAAGLLVARLGVDSWAKRIEAWWTARA